MGKSKIETRVEASLREQLRVMGADIACFSDLISDYMGLWRVKNGLIADIKTRGVVYKDVSSVGVEMQKNNPSVKELVNVNKQMLMLLDKLGLSTDKCKLPPGDDDFDL